MTWVGFENYTIAGDVAVIATCLVMVILLTSSYVRRTRAFHIFMNIIVILVAAATVNMAFHTLLERGDPGLHGAVYAMRILYHALLLEVFFLFTLYATVISGMERHKARKVAVGSTALLVGLVAADIVTTVNGTGFHIDENGLVTHRVNPFIVGYALYVALLAALMSRVRRLLYKRVMYGFYGTMAVSVLICLGQLVLNQATLTTMTFVFPVIAMLYIMHSTPYNISLGTVDVGALEDMVRMMVARKTLFLFISILLPEYDVEGKVLPEALRASVRRFSGDYFRNGVMFRVGNGHVIQMVPKRKNGDYERRIQNLLDGFEMQYQRFRIPYKIVIGESMEEISQKNEYVSLVRSIQNRLPDNTVYRVGPEDITRFNREEYILSQLKDIYDKQDVEDPRVLAFCQPVFNLQTGRFDTAEALMRLKLEQTGLVYPDQFIPLAESHGYIHVLTEIILHKTCREIRRMTEEGYRISRVSVNVSVLELKDESFCGDINRIIDDNRISGEKIAIELTESRTESDFMIMKEKIEQLRRQGIQFYLDDFGTGYSNMERIMELPFDIIKFDRSLVIASGTDERSERIVENLAHMFRDMEYSVLYEGVEDDMDEDRCREMSASYLQGYKYSRPVPIERLRDYLPMAG